MSVDVMSTIWDAGKYAKRSSIHDPEVCKIHIVCKPSIMSTAQ